jgi:hypothetical protein
VTSSAGRDAVLRNPNALPDELERRVLARRSIELIEPSLQREFGRQAMKLTRSLAGA